jgi:hypothetical protein
MILASPLSSSASARDRLLLIRPSAAARSPRSATSAAQRGAQHSDRYQFAMSGMAELCPAANAQQERPMNHQPRKENHMNTVQKAILRACWQEEQCGLGAASMAARVPRSRGRNDEYPLVNRRKANWPRAMAGPPQRRGTPRSIPRQPSVLGAWTNLRPGVGCPRI